MLEFSRKTNLLEQTAYHYALQDVADPNLYRQIYEYSSIPKTPFNFRRVPLGMPEEIFITDTSFRDGQQSQAPYTVEHIVKLFQMLSRLGGHKGLIRQTEFFVYSARDREAIDRCLDLGLEYPEITTWIRATPDDFKLLRHIGVRETGMLMSCSDYHIFRKLHMTRAQAMEKYLNTVRMAFEAGVRPRCHLEDITRADFYGFVIPLVNELMDMSREAGIPVKIRACDTMGYGLPFTGVALPRSVAGIVYGLRHYSGVPSEMLEWHGHNDFYKAVANASTAWLYGVSAVNCSMLGIGERTGNIPLEAMVMEYASLRGTLDGMDSTVITEIANLFRDEMGYEIPEMTPFVGQNFNVTKAGIHADGLLKDEEIYNIFDTKTLLNRPALVAVSSTSGLAGIAYWLNQYFRLEGDQAIQKQDPITATIKKWVDLQYAEGRQTVISAHELENMALSLAPQRFRAPGIEEDAGMDKSGTLSDSVYAAIEDDILTGRCAAGENMTEMKLCERLGVSRTPVREALKRLAQDGLVELTGNKGAIVLGITPKDLADIYAIRMRIEGLAARMAALKASEQQLRAMTEAVELEEFYTSRGDTDQIKNMDSRFHELIYESADSRPLMQTLRNLHHKIHRYRRLSLAIPDRARNVSAEHRMVLQAIVARDGDAAECLMNTHIQNAKRSLMTACGIEE